MKRPSRSFEIALSAISCAVVALALTLGSYVDVLLFAGFMVAVFALMVPLCKEFWWGAVLAYLGGLLLAFLFCGFSFLYLLPFAVFFGLHPIVNALQKKFVHQKWQHVLCCLAKAIWFDLVMWLCWGLVFVPLFGADQMTWYPYIEEYFYYVLFFGGTLLFVPFDYLIFLCQRSVDAMVRRIRR